VEEARTSLIGRTTIARSSDTTQLHFARARDPRGQRARRRSWLHEIKFDGYRTATRIEGGKVRLLTRTGLDWTARFRPIATALASLPVKTAYLDGEVAVLGPDGVTSFAALQDALSKGHAADLVYFAFDLLHLDGLDLTPLPLIERKAALKMLLGRRAVAGRFATPTMSKARAGPSTHTPANSGWRAS